MDRHADLRAAGTLPLWDPGAGPAASEFAQGDLIYQRYGVYHHIPTDTNDVYFCLEMGSWNHVAVKIARSHPDDRTGVDQSRIFSQEVQNWASLGKHPNLVRCLYAGFRNDRWFLVLEWVGAPDPGKNLKDYYRSDLKGMDAPGRLAEIVRLGSDICDGLTYIHAHGIAHGDLKPQNVLIDKNGRAKITDLGQGTWLDQGTAPGSSRSYASRARAKPRLATLAYAAPELWEGWP